jgi:hypothetical protein
LKLGKLVGQFGEIGESGSSSDGGLKDNKQEGLSEIVAESPNPPNSLMKDGNPSQLSPPAQPTQDNAVSHAVSDSGQKQQEPDVQGKGFTECSQCRFYNIKASTCSQFPNKIIVPTAKPCEEGKFKGAA